MIGHFKQSVANRANQAFRMVAWSPGHSKCYLGAFYRKVSGQKGSLTAIKATARKVAIIFWNMMCRKTEYEVHSPADYEARYQRAGSQA